MMVSVLLVFGMKFVYVGFNGIMGDDVLDV